MYKIAIHPFIFLVKLQNATVYMILWLSVVVYSCPTTTTDII